MESGKITELAFPVALQLYFVVVDIIAQAGPGSQVQSRQRRLVSGKQEETVANMRTNGSIVTNIALS